MVTLRLLLVAPLASILLVAGCASEPAPSAPAPAAAPPTAPAASSSGLTLVTGNGPRGAVVTLEPDTPREFPPPSGPVILDQYSKQFVPGVLLARVGQTVEFRNSEDTPHNVNVTRTPSGAEIFNVSTDPFQKHVHAFESEGRYNVTCDIHPGMQATVIVTRTPYAIVVDDTGRFSIPDVATGRYTLRIAGSRDTAERQIEVAGARMDIR